MKRLFRSALTVLLALAFILLFAQPSLAGDEGPKTSAVGFNVDQGDHKLPPGSTVRHSADGVTEVKGPNGSLLVRQKDIESEQIYSPFCRVAATHVFSVPSGSKISRKGNETEVSSEGTVILRIIDDQSVATPKFSGWIEQANDWSVSNLEAFAATWKVPSKPPRPGSNVVDFLFNAIEPATGNEIIQPVLEWNQAGSGGWTLRSWYGPVNGNYFASSPVFTTSGHSITGTLSHASGGWSIVTRDADARTGGSTSLGTDSMGTSSLAVFCALEGYNVAGNKDVPGTTTFSNVSFTGDQTIVWHSFIDPSTKPYLSGLRVAAQGVSKVILYTANK
jgi:hypothetical protein